MKRVKPPKGERRKHTRFQFPFQAYALIRPGPLQTGFITDISRGGFAFTYPAAPNAATTCKPREVDLLLSDFSKTYSLKALAVEAVADNDDQTKADQAVHYPRKHRFVFKNLTNSQRLRLVSLLSVHAVKQEYGRADNYRIKENKALRFWLITNS